MSGYEGRVAPTGFTITWKPARQEDCAQPWKPAGPGGCVTVRGGPGRGRRLVRPARRRGRDPRPGLAAGQPL